MCTLSLVHVLWCTVASKVALETQLSSLSTSQSATSTEAETLKHRIEDVEREKRNLVAVVSRLEEDAARREGLTYSYLHSCNQPDLWPPEEIQTLRANLKQARQENQALESQVRELRSTETSTKVRDRLVS